MDPDGLNPSQRDAVRTLSGPLLVLAGAGTGKTRVVTFRIAELIRHGIPPGKILAVTFTNKAAGEMQERAAALLGRRRPEKPEISTFHSLCVRVLRRHIRLLGYPDSFTICDRGDQESAARGALRDIQVSDAVLRPGDLVNQISRWKSAAVRPAQAASLARTDQEHLAALAYRRYQRALKLAGAVDFDDLLLCVEELFVEHESVRRAEADRFQHLLVDEYQDTNGAQYRIVKALATEHRNLCVVGDDDQSIYGWRGAEVTHILRFQRDWPEAKVVRLEENYRSTEAILTLANDLIRHNRQRHDKVLRAHRTGGIPPRVLQFVDETVEAREIVDEIRKQVFDRSAEPRDFAILFRTNEQPRPFEAELRRAKIPYTLIGGQSFFDRKEVRDVLAYLRLLAVPGDEIALLRVINTPPRGIGPKAVETLLERAVNAGRPVNDVLDEARDWGVLTPAALAGLERLQTLLARYRDRIRQDSLVTVASDLLVELRYQAEIHRLYKEPQDQQARWNSVEEVINTLAAYCAQAPQATLREFLDDVALGGREMGEDKESQLAKNAVVLMTLHSAKGLEFPQVYLVGLTEGTLPHGRSLLDGGKAVDEERRLCYVGVTRARTKLTLSLPLSRFKWGKPRPTIASRFLFEMLGKADTAQAKQALSEITQELARERRSQSRSRARS